MKRRGLLLTTRRYGGKLHYIYMYRDLFAEVIFENNDPGGVPLEVTWIRGLQRLNEHIEKALRDK